MLYITIGGNIGVGKSTSIETVKVALEEKLGIPVIAVPEPVKGWGKALDLFYKDPSAYACLFQQMVIATRVGTVVKAFSEAPEGSIVLVERNLMEDRIFAVNAPMTESEFTHFYSKTYDALCNVLPVPNMRLYLQAPPEVCLERMKKRARTEECGVSLEYLQGLHEGYEALYEGGYVIDAKKNAEEVLKDIVAEIIPFYERDVRIRV